VRKFDRGYIKPLLLREDDISKDQKLLNTFKQINELYANKMAQDPAYFTKNKGENYLNSIDDSIVPEVEAPLPSK
jgi:hypothetical protein